MLSVEVKDVIEGALGALGALAWESGLVFELELAKSAINGIELSGFYKVNIHAIINNKQMEIFACVCVPIPHTP